MDLLRSVKDLARRRPPFGLVECVLISIGLALAFDSKWICDDGYIYFRYIDNLLVRKIGLVFNPGEYVEGFTSPLWMLLLTAVRFVFRAASPRHLTFVLSLALAAAAFSFLAWINRRALREAEPGLGGGRPELNFFLPLVMAVSTRAIIDFSTSGLSTPLVMLFAVLAAGELLRTRERPVRAGLLAGLGPLVRPDLAIVSLILLIHVFWRGKWKAGLRATALAALPPLLYESFRVWYYASLLPNTFFAKSCSGADFTQGFDYLRDLTEAYHTQFLFIALILCISFLWFTRRTFLSRLAAQNRIFILAAILAYGAYVLYIGGDYMHGRLWVPVLMMLYAGFSGVLEPLLGPLLPRKLRGGVVGAKAVGLLVAGAVMALFLPMRSVEKNDERPRLILNEREWQISSFDGKDISAWNFHPDNPMVRQAAGLRALSRSAGKPVPIAHSMIGYLGYYGTADVVIIDKLGLVDAVAARTKIKERAYVGHERCAPGAYLLTRKPWFWETPFEEYNRLFDFLPEYFPVTNLEPALLEELGHRVHSDLLGKARAAINLLLDQPGNDPNLIFLLSRLTESWEGFDPSTRERIAKAAEELGSFRGGWASWLEANEEKLRIIDRQIHNGHRFGENLALAVKTLKIRFDPSE